MWESRKRQELNEAATATGTVGRNESIIIVQEPREDEGIFFF
jgi:hypothetical protein